YGRRHVLQLCAIKALQAGGLPLGEVQARLYGRSNSELEALVASSAESRRQKAAIHMLRWREVSIEPGLRIIAEEGLTPLMPAVALEEKIRAALAALNDGGAK